MKNKRYSWSALLLMCLLVFGTVFSSCDEGEDLSTNQMEDGAIALNVFGPSPAVRGGELRFIGTNLDKVTSIDLPGAEGITDITVVGKYEIRITIPQSAQPGLIILNTPDGKITSKTPIGYSEPISISSIAPLAIKAGAVLTIEGDYLNIVEEVIFADGIHVLKADFESQTRAKIEVKVPLNAQSGKVIVSNGADLLSNGEEIPVWVYSEEELDVTLPTYETHNPTTPKSGNTLTITGADMDLVAFVKFEGAEVSEVEVSEDAKTLTLEVPETAKDGEVSLVCFSGVEVAIGNITFVKPTAAIEDKKASYDVDEVVVLNGTDLDLVTKAAFPNGEETAVTLTQDGKINLTVTEAAQSGLITLVLANGNTVSVDGFETSKPVAEFPADATPLDELDIVSTLGSRVKAVMFGDLEAEVTASGSGFKVTVPLAAETGEVTLVMDNGETVAAGSIVINAFTFCAVVEFAEETTTVGELMKCFVVNGASLSNVLLNGTDAKYLIVGEELYVSVGEGLGDQELTLVSDQTNVNYTIRVVPPGEVETVLYDTAIELVDFNKNHELNIDFSGAPADASVRIRYAKTTEQPQIKVFDGHWNNVFDGSNDGHAADVAAASYIDLPVSLFPYSDWGYSIILQGDGMIVSSISIVEDRSPAVTVFDTPTAIGSWGNIQIAADAFASAAVGQVITVVTSDLGDNAQGSFKGGDWVQIAEGTEYFDISGDFSLTITTDILAKLKSGGLIISGQNYSVVKVTLK